VRGEKSETVCRARWVFDCRRGRSLFIKTACTITGSSRDRLVCHQQLPIVAWGSAHSVRGVPIVE
jgi:hypothetical protein